MSFAARRILTVIAAVLATLPLFAQMPENRERGFAADKLYQLDGINNINLFNQNNMLSIPIGQNYHVSAALSYGLSLNYNSNVWDYDTVCTPVPASPDDCIPYVIPSPVFNAGLGWYLSLGELLPGSSSWIRPSGRGVYIAPDGSRHKFLDDGRSDDTSLLRLRVAGNDYWELDSPDGIVRRFHKEPGNDDVLRLVEIRDAFSQVNGQTVRNWVRISYNTLVNRVEPGAETWAITDSAGRQLNIYFRTVLDDYVDYSRRLLPENGWHIPHPRNVIAEIDVPGIGGTTETYKFGYDVPTAPTVGTVITRDNEHDAMDLTQDNARVAILTGITLPDGSKYLMTKPDGTPDYDFTSNLESSGVLNSLTLPTLGKLSWTYGRNHFPTKDDESRFVRPKDGGLNFEMDGLGVRTKTIFDPIKNTTSQWSYQPAVTPPGDKCPTTKDPYRPCQARELVVTITDPLGFKTENYFSTCLDTLHEADGWYPDEYGLPVSHNDKSQPGRGLSTRTLALDGTVVRSTYTGFEDNQADPHQRHMRLRATRTVFNDDDGTECPNCYVDSESSEYDGFGHYRKVVTTTNFKKVSASEPVKKTVYTDYNGATATNGGMPTSQDGSRGPVPAFSDGDPWILNTWTRQYTSTTDSSGTETLASSAQFDFDPHTGFLRRKRTMLGDMPQNHDMLAVYSADDYGNVRTESYYGGDSQTLDLNDDPGATVPPDPPKYKVENTYQNGLLTSSKYKSGNGDYLLISEATVDPSIGVVTDSKDASGLLTHYTFGIMGRLTDLQPPYGAGAPAEATHFFYHNASGTTGAYVEVKQPADGSLTSALFQYDGLGRVVRERNTLPDSDSVQETQYNANGWKAAVSERESTPAHFTRFTEFDPFGRPHRIQSPDQNPLHDTVVNYVGSRKITRTIHVATSSDGSETPSTTTETYDAFGHLRQVEEPSGSGDSNISTYYDYDGADHLIGVSTSDLARDAHQTRAFRYDHRGLLLREQHPEKGLTGNGWTVYEYDPATNTGGYDARGHLLRRREEGSTKYDQEFVYDPAERLVQVKERGTQRAVKEFIFDTVSDAGHSYSSAGRLVKSVRHNYSAALGDVTVSTYLKYDAAGRVSSKETAISSGPSFTQLFTYNSLGLPDHLTYPSCTGCGSASIPDRSIALDYSRGLLHSVAGFASSISYWPNGMMHQVVHSNGPVDTQNIDTSTGMARPLSISFDNVTSCSDISITRPPSSAKIKKGETFTLSVTATAPSGFVLAYQWYQGTSGDVSHPINGATGTTYTTPALLETTSYWVRISSDSCFVNSDTATITVCPPIVFTQQPRSIMLAPASGDVWVSTSFAALGQKLTYGPVLENGAEVHDPDVELAGTTVRAKFHGLATQIRHFQVRVTDECNVPRDSDEFTLGVGTCLDVLSYPQDTIVFQGGNSFLLDMRINGENAQTPWKYEYHWHHGIDGQDVDLFAADPVSWNKPEITATLSGSYEAWWCEVRSATCGNVTSPKAHIKLYGTCPLPVLTASPQTLDIGSNSHTFTAACDWPGLTYQWYSGPAGDTHLPVSGATAATFDPTIAGSYWVRVTDECGREHKDSQTLVATSGSCPNPIVITGEPKSVDIAWGERPTLHVEATNVTNYTWYQLDPNGGSTGAVGFNKDFTPAVSPQVTTSYQAYMTGPCNNVVSLPATIHIKRCSSITIAAQPAGGTIVSTEATGFNLSISATSTGGAIAYQWYTGETGDATHPIAGATASTLHVLPATTTSYWVRLTTASCTIDSDTAVVTVCTPPSFTGPNDPVTEDISYGQSIRLGAPVNGDGVHYEWHADSPASSIIVGTEPIVLVHPVNTTVYYGVITGSCGSITTAPITVRVCRTPAIDQQPQNVTIFSGKTATLSVTASELNNVPLTYQWQEVNGPVVGSAATYTTPALTQPKQYVVHVAAGSCTIDSSVASVNICTLPEVITTGTTQNVALGQQVTLNCVFSPGTGNTFTWYSGPAGDYSHSTQVSANSSPAFTFVANTSGTYWASISRTDDGCVSHTDAYTVNVCIPTMQTQPVGGGYDLVHPVTLSLVANSATSYQWYTGTKGDTTNPVAGATGASITVTPAGDTYYWCRVTGSCGTVDSDSVLVTRCVPPAITTQPSGASITQGQSVTIGAGATGTGLSYQWYQGTSGNTANPVYGNTPSITVNPLNTIDYWVKVTGTCGSVNSNTAHVMVCTTPVINTQPVGANVFSGQTVTLSVAASENGSEPLHYQWYTTGNTPVGTDSPTYTTPPITQETPYFVHVSAGSCSVDSNIARFYLCTLPQIIGTGTAQNVAIGQTVTLSCVISPATGNTFIWYYGPVGDVAHSAQVSSTNSNTYSFTAAATNGGTYWATVSRTDDGCVSRTNAYTVNVCVPTITTQPAASTMINSGQSLTLTVAANTSGLTYQWYVGTSGTTTTPISGATAASVTVNPTVNTNYWVKVTGTCGQSVNSNTAAVTICQPASITTQPAASTNITRGQSVNLSVGASGTGLSYQWYQGTSGNTANPLAATTPGLTISPQNTTDYWVKVTGTCGAVQNSTTAHVAVCMTPVITQQPMTQYVFLGQTATFTVAATEGTTEPLHYQWYVDGGTPVGTDSPSYTTPPVNSSHSYFVRVIAASCYVDSNSVLATGCTLPQVINSGTTNNVAIGQSVTLSCTVSPSTGNTFVWYYGPVGDVAHSAQVSSTNSSTYTFNAATGNAGTYWATVSRSDDGCVSRTNAYTVNVCVPAITTQPAASTMINSGQSLTLSVAANTSGLTYQWYVGTSGTTTTPISGATGASVTVSPTTATNYWVKVTGTCGQSVNSNTAAVTICQPPSITSQPSPNSYIVRGYSVSLGVTAAGNGLTYQWYQGTSGNTSAPLAATTPGLTIAPQYPTDYWVKVTGTCGSVNSNTAHVAVCVTPVINTQPQGTSIFSGSSTTLSVSASEATGETLHYQWYKTGNLPLGTDSPTLNTGTLTSDTSFFVHITAASGTCSIDSNTAAITMCPLAQTVTGAPNQNTTPGQTVRLQLPAMSGATAYLWYSGTSGNTASPLTGWQAANYLDVSPTTTSNYWAQVQNGSCVSNTTTTTVNVCIPTVTTQPQNVTTSSSATLTVASNLSGSTYQWYIGTSGTTTTPVSGATAASVTVSPASTTNYWCKVTGTCGVSANSNTATVTICSAPTITAQPVNAAPVYRNQSSGLSVTATGTNLTYQWYSGASGDTSHPVSGATGTSYIITAANSERYWVRVTGMCGTRDSNAAWISVIPQFLQQPVQTTYLSSGSRVTLSVNVYSNGYLHYAWCYDANGQTVPGSPDAPTWTTSDITASNVYFCRVTSGIASAESYRAYVNLCDGGNSAGAPYATSAGGNCRYLWSQAGGNYDHIEWYQGQKGDTSYQIGNGYYMYTCSNVGTTVWYRVVGYDANQGQSCYTDSPSMTVP